MLMTDSDLKIQLVDVTFSYTEKGPPVLKGLTAAFKKREITAIVGPSGQGKSTLLTILNRLWEEVPGARRQGQVKLRLEGRWVDIYTDGYPIDRLRRAVGLVFQKPNPLPMSIYKNVAFPLKLAGEKDKAGIEEKVHAALQRAFLWSEVKDRLNADARCLSGGQQQRLCIARALILEPEVLLLDEPTASLDPTAAGVIESLLSQLKDSRTILMVSHYMDQVRRVADRTMELAHGKLMDNDPP